MTTSRLKKVLKKRSRNRFFGQLLLWLGALLVAFYLFTFREIPVLMYHFIGTESQAQEDSLVVSAKTFDQQLSWLQKWGYQVYSLDEFYNLKTSGRFSFRKGVVITFDDGNIGFLTNALPILERYGMPAANFMVTDSMRQKTNGSMSIESARKLAENPLITLGAHTAHHLVLIDQPDSVMREEIVDSRRDLEKMIGREVWYFAYPGGFFDSQALQMVKAAGYRFAFTTSWKRLGGQNETLFTLTRVKITERDSNPALFWYKVSGLYPLFKRLSHAL